jgi:hypothetical protein
MTDACAKAVNGRQLAAERRLTLLGLVAAVRSKERTFVLILDEGEEALGAITALANEEQYGASVSAVRAFRRADVG